MSNEKNSKVGRREFLRSLAVSATGVAAAAAPLSGAARADTETRDEKRQARYNPNSAHIQTYYRIIRYPGK
jgi:nitrous oxide reductase